MLLGEIVHINMDKIKRPKLYTLPDALSRQPSPAAVTICPRGRSGIECRPVQSVRVRWGHLGGIGPEARVGVVSPVSSDQNKKGTFFAKTHPTFTKRNPSDCASLQKFRKIQKDPLRSH